MRLKPPTVIPAEKIRSALFFFKIEMIFSVASKPSIIISLNLTSTILNPLQYTAKRGIIRFNFLNL